MEFRNTITCKGTEYQTNIKAVSEELTITISDISKQNIWFGLFNSSQIEDLTSKTGSMKSYTTFCKLLVAALQGKNPALHVDFYSYQDLETIRNGSSTLAVSTRPSKKKYLIISYLTDFEKAHYPLPLIIQDLPAEKDSTISKNSAEILSENLKLKQENHMLQKKLKNFQEEFINYRENSEGRIEELTSVKQGLESELQRMKEELDVIIAQLEEEAKKRSNSGSNHDVKSLKNSLSREREENSVLRAELSESRREVEIMRKNEATNKKLIEMLTKRFERSEENEIDSPISADSPRNISLKFNNPDSLQSSNNFKELNDFSNQVTKIHQLLKKNKS